MHSEAPPDRWHDLLVRLRLIAQPQIVCQGLCRKFSFAMICGIILPP
jgi:hypothetical protein